MKSRILAAALVAVVAAVGFPGAASNLYPDGTPVIRDQGRYPSDPPIIRGYAQNAPPTIRDIGVNDPQLYPADPPTVRD